MTSGVSGGGSDQPPVGEIDSGNMGFLFRLDLLTDHELPSSGSLTDGWGGVSPLWAKTT